MFFEIDNTNNKSLNISFVLVLFFKNERFIYKL